MISAQEEAPRMIDKKVQCDVKKGVGGKKKLRENAQFSNPRNNISFNGQGEMIGCKGMKSMRKCLRSAVTKSVTKLNPEELYGMKDSKGLIMLRQDMIATIANAINQMDLSVHCGLNGFNGQITLRKKLIGAITEAIENIGRPNGHKAKNKRNCRGGADGSNFSMKKVKSAARAPDKAETFGLGYSDCRIEGEDVQHSFIT